ncbi:glycosyltransferase [Leucobacter triazinivorans]|uniref:Glycosyltransferase n=1 Tax=Leucobacter triazinivorans TaxID=1784719 RepID=A0A4P6KF97_9MICO|nr:glycosyltransferase [Leucobacter triazinivorans]QBE48641.1 glycosyltransferase [Leucobacter triazinivorans]
MSGVFISWTRANGRTAELARELDLQPCFTYAPSRFGLLGRYVKQFLSTRALMRRLAPRRVMLMLPPAPALLALPRPRSGESRLVADLHTGFFLDPKWRWASRFALGMLRRRGAVAAVTNDALRATCERAGVEAVVLHDLIVERDPAPSHGYVICPLSYANDEPLTELLEAARLTPEVRWVLTGAPPQALRQRAPANISFTGFVEADEFDRLVRESTGVIALTTRPHTMQRAGYEAFNAGVPQLTSDFPELRAFYGDSACYTSAAPDAIAQGARELLARHGELARRLLELRPQRVSEQAAALEQLRRALDPSHSASPLPAQREA